MYRITLKTGNLIWLFLISLAVFSQEVGMVNVGVNQGIRNPFIYDIEITNDGYVWVAAGDGVYQYNGSKIVAHYSNNLAEKLVTSLYQSADSTLWCGHYEGGISTIKNGKVSVLKEGYSDNPVAGFSENSQGVFAFVNGGTIVDLSNNAVKATDYAHDLVGNINGVSKQLIYSEKGLFKYSNQNLLEVENIELIDEEIVTVIPASNYQLAVSISGKLYSITENDISFISNQFEEEIVVNDVVLIQNDLILATNKGVYIKDIRAPKESYLTHISTNNGLLTNKVNTLAVDKNNNIYLGTYGKGMQLLPNTRVVSWESENDIVNVHYGTSKLHIISVDNIRTYESHCFHNNRGNVVLVVDGEIQASTFSNDSLFLLINGNEIWAVDNQMRFEKLNYRLPLIENPTSISTNGVGGFWITTSTHGVYSINKNEVENLTTRNGLSTNEVSQVFDDGNQLWLASSKTALTAVQNDSFAYYSFENGLANLNINAITTDAKGRVLVGTDGGGLYIKNDKKFEAVELDYRFNYNYGFVKDDKNVLWSASSKMISQLTDSFQVNKIIYHDIDYTFNNAQPLTYDYHNSIIYVANKRAIAGVYLSYYPTNTTQIQLKLNKLLVSGEAKPVTNMLSLPYGFHRVQAFFETVGFVDQEVKFQYKINGIDEQWNSMAGNELYLPGLQEGEYNVQVRGVAEDNVVLTQQRSLVVFIATPYWKKTWFFVLVAIIVGAIGFVILKWREKQHLKIQRQLEEKVKERTTDLLEQNEEIERFTYSVSHDLKAPVLNVTGLVDALSQMPDEAAEQKGQLLDMIKTNTTKISQNLSELMDTIKDRNEAKNAKEHIVLKELIDDICTQIYVSIKETKGKITQDLSVERVNFDKRQLNSVIYNLLNNSIKYRSPQRNPHIHITSRSSGDYTLIEVKDNGMGIDMEKDGDKVFSAFGRINEDIKGTGIGLNLVKEMLEKRGGKIDFDSELGVGSAFKVYVPN